MYRLNVKKGEKPPHPPYFPLGLPPNKKITNKTCNFIKTIWTQNISQAVTSFKVIPGDDESFGNSNNKNDMVLLDGNRKIVRIMNDKDDSKPMVLTLTKTRKEKENTKDEFWSCTENIGLIITGGECPAKNAFLCWKWKAKDTGKFALKIKIILSKIIRNDFI